MMTALKSVYCKQEQGLFLPIVNREKYEGKTECFVVPAKRTDLEQGSHTALLAKSEVYENLWLLQFADFEVLEVKKAHV